MTRFDTVLHHIFTLAMLLTLYWIYAAGSLAVRPGGALAVAARQCGALALARHGGAVTAAQWRGVTALAPAL